MEFLVNWQTLIAGFLALLGALITTGVLLKQHSSDQKRYRQDRERRAFYLRASLADALSDLVEYSRECFQYVHWNKDFPQKPKQAIDILKANIEFADIVTSENLFKISSFYQVHNSRLDSYAQSDSINKKEHMLYDISLLNHYFLRLFRYARNQEKFVQDIFPTKEEIRNSVDTLIGIHEYQENFALYEEIFNEVEKYRKNNE